MGYPTGRYEAQRGWPLGYTSGTATLPYLLGTSHLHKPIFCSTMASAKDTTPVLTSEQDAVQLLASLPVRRQLSQTLDIDELSQLSSLLMEFLKSPNVRKAPSKGHLTTAVNALLQPGASPVSPKWKKPQLAGVLQRWVDEAQLLQNPEHQGKLYLEVKSTKGKKYKKVDLNKAIFTQEDDGSLTTFALSSPDSRTKADNGFEPMPLTQPTIDEALLAAMDLSPPEIGTPSSLRTPDATQVRRVHDVARLNELMELANNETPAAGSDNGDREHSPAEILRTGGPGIGFYELIT